MWRIATACTALFCAFTAAAGAAERTGGSVTVLSTGTLSIAAQATTTGGVCLDVTRDGSTTTDTLCPKPSAVGLRTLRLPGATVLFGAAPAAVHRLDVTLGRRTLKRATTAADGFDARFYAVALDGRPALGAVTARGASGAIRAAKDLDPFALPRLGRRWIAATVADERRQPAAVDVVAARVLRDRRGHRTAALCARLGGRGAVCAPKPRRIELRFAASCDTGREVVYGLAPAFVHSATGRLASGARIRLTVKRVPRKRVGRAGSVLLAEVRNGHVERVSVRDRAGRRVGSATLSANDC